MDKALVEEWVRRLESGNYRQTTGRLREPATKKGKKPSYCCLGVAKTCLGLRGFSGAHLSFVERARLGVSDKSQSKLIAMNDKDRQSFKQIAKWIRENILNKKESK